MIELLRKHLLMLLLVSIPSLALTDIRPWSSAAVESPFVDLPSVGFLPTIESTPQIQRLPRVSLSEQPWFQQLQLELQELGAIYVSLEKWDSRRPVYEFRCDLRREGSGHQTIQALSGSPRSAAEQVLSRARIWYGRAGEQVRSVYTAKPEARRRPTKYLSPDAINWQ